MNIAVTAIGSMSSEAVIRSLRYNGSNKIIGFDIYPQDWVVTSKLVDLFYRVPLAHDKDYLDKIFEICLQNKISFLFPLTDPEVDVLSVYSEKFRENGINICLSNPTSVAIARDKLEVYNFFKDNSIVTVIPTFKSVDEISIKAYEDLIAKPRKGRSSEGVIKFRDPEITKHPIINRADYIFQPIINGDYITVDTIRSSDGSHISIARKELLRTQNGAGFVVEIFKDKELEATVNVITDALDIYGCINIEFILQDDKYYLMDINPRFSAGIGFSIIAGYDFVINNLRCFQGIPIEPGIDYDTRILSKRYVDIINK